MDALRFRAGISHRSFPGCAIVLDLDRDRYWQVGTDAASALDWLADRRAGPIDPGQFTRLERLGFVEPAQSGPPLERAPCLPSPTHSAIEGSARKQSFDPIAATEVAYLAAMARRLAERRSLRWNIADIEHRRTSANGAPAGSLAALAQHFSRYRRLVPLANKCLPDTLAFLRFAARRGHFPRLVFGVEAWPFAAHCWAQADDLVLNDVLDHARSFSPILVI
ncbi:MAG: lasso peptide biosynthesis B2 protein [Sphingomonadales bacterium]|nr:lasso peptide biosynthesis B2 protein [Sphingomonadales bacterium]